MSISLHCLPFSWSSLFARQSIHHSKLVARLLCELNFSTLCIMLNKSELKPMEGGKKDIRLLLEPLLIQCIASCCTKRVAPSAFEQSREIGFREGLSKRIQDVVTSSLTYLDLLLVHIGGLKMLVCNRELWASGVLTKLLTMILESPLPPAGPFGTAALVGPLAALVFFWIPPAGTAAAGLFPIGTRRPRPRGPAFLAAVRRVVRISSRLLSSLLDMMKVLMGMVG